VKTKKRGEMRRTKDQVKETTQQIEENADIQYDKEIDLCSTETSRTSDR
jgi:hypothetical protein